MAYEHHVLWVPHGWNMAVGLAADIQLACAMPVAKYVEFLTPSPYVDDLIAVPFRPDADDMLTILDKAGLGIELNREALKKYGC
jgi:L-alanine-DL-glutamate epimerase-like enolase superfamily enzyme